MKKQMTALLLCLALLLSGCALVSAPAQEENSYLLYFREANLDNAVGSDALRAVPVQLEATQPNALAEELMRRLLEGSRDEHLRSTIPMGTALLSIRVEEGRAEVDLSAPYGTLSGVALTLADYAIALTLTQLPEISSVKITVRGQELAYREKQIFLASDVLLSPKEDVVGSVPAVLYFLDEQGGLAAEERSLDLYEGDTQIGVVARALEAGPESKALFPIYPEGFRVKSLWMEEDTCYVNFSSALLGYLPPNRNKAQQVVEALTQSLTSLDSVSEVRFLVDGEAYQNYAGIDIGYDG